MERQGAIVSSHETADVADRACRSPEGRHDRQRTWRTVSTFASLGVLVAAVVAEVREGAPSSAAATTGWASVGSPLFVADLVEPPVPDALRRSRDPNAVGGEPGVDARAPRATPEYLTCRMPPSPDSRDARLTSSVDERSQKQRLLDKMHADSATETDYHLLRAICMSDRDGACVDVATARLRALGRAR